MNTRSSKTGIPPKMASGLTMHSIVTVPAVGGPPIITWSLPPRDSHLTQVKSASSVNGAASSTMDTMEAMALVGKTSTAHVPFPERSPWIITDLPNVIETGRILVYSHGRPDEGSTIESLAITLLEKIIEERKTEVISPAYSSSTFLLTWTQEDQKKPLFFIGHSTGGLVVKAALIKARGHLRYRVIGDNCYGVAFFGLEPFTLRSLLVHRLTNF